jgi:hypothetical protein
MGKKSNGDKPPLMNAVLRSYAADKARQMREAAGLAHRRTDVALAVQQMENAERKKRAKKSPQDKRKIWREVIAYILGRPIPLLPNSGLKPVSRAKTEELNG